MHSFVSGDGAASGTSNGNERGARLFLVVDQTLVRRGVRELLERHGRFCVVGEAGDPREAAGPLARTSADLALCALYAHPGPAVGWLGALKRAHPACRILIVEEMALPGGLDALLSSGADGVIPSRAELAELLLALDSIRRGYPFLSPALAGRITSGREDEG